MLAKHGSRKVPYFHDYNNNNNLSNNNKIIINIAIMTDHVVENVDAVKRAYGGATASRLNYYAKAIIEDDIPVRYKQFYEKSQSVEETTEEIMSQQWY